MGKPNTVNFDPNIYGIADFKFIILSHFFTNFEHFAAYPADAEFSKTLQLYLYLMDFKGAMDISIRIPVSLDALYKYYIPLQMLYSTNKLYHTYYNLSFHISRMSQVLD